jgi:hypothetical protein
MKLTLRNILLFFISFIFIATSCDKRDSGKQALSDNSKDWQYFGVKTPGNIPEIFSSEIISTQRSERDITFSPDGDMIFYSLVMPSREQNLILFLRYDGFSWSDPEIAAFSGVGNDLEPSFAPNGKKFFFISKRTGNTDIEKKDWDIWFLEPEKGWTNPVNLGSPVNTDKNEYYPTVTSSGNLYFTADYDNSFGMDDIYFSRFENGSYTEPVNLGNSVNSQGYDFNAFIAPDESYLLFSSFGRADELGGGDLYISYHKSDCRWSIPKNMGSRINSDRLDYCPRVSGDGKFLFFTSEREDPNFKRVPQHKLKELLQLADDIENGLGNIYWVKFDKDAWK